MAQLYRLLGLTILVLGLIGCSSESSDLDNEPANSLALNVQVVQGATNGSGIASLSFSIPPNTSAFGVTISGQTTSKYEIVDLTNPAGEILLTAGSLSTATSNPISSFPPIAFNYPADPGLSGTLTPGAYTLRVIVTGKNGKFSSNAPVTLSYITKGDGGDFSRAATIDVNAILSGAVANDEQNTTSIKAALGKVQNMFDDRNIKLAIRLIERPDYPSVLPNPSDHTANNIYEGISNSYPFTINLVFGADLLKLDSKNHRYAEGGFIPLPAIPSSRSVIALSVEDLAGSDGEFDKDRDEGDDLENQEFNDETLQMASVIAHEIGHALGLKNTVEITGERVIDADTLSDTGSCVEEDNCESDRDTNRNIMFPYTLKKRGSDNDFWSRDTITEQQAIVIKQNVLTRLN